MLFVFKYNEINFQVPTNTFAILLPIVVDFIICPLKQLIQNNRACRLQHPFQKQSGHSPKYQRQYTANDQKVFKPIVTDTVHRGMGLIAYRQSYQLDNTCNA